MEYKYLAPKAHSFSCRLTINEKPVKIKFEHGVFTTSDVEVAKALDDGIAKSPSLKLMIRAANMDEAAALVKEHQAKISAQAQTGPMTSDALHDLQTKATHASGNALAESAPNNPEALQDLQDAMASDTNKEAAGDAVVVTEQAGEDATEPSGEPATPIKPLAF